jgi:hypothetical protein
LKRKGCGKQDETGDLYKMGTAVPEGGDNREEEEMKMYKEKEEKKWME